MNSYVATASTIDRKWYVVDAEGKTLGRLASEVAKVLRGKNKPTYTPFLDCGDYVIIVNADKIAVTGKKLDQKVYHHHSDYVGGMKETTLREKLAKKPESKKEEPIDNTIAQIVEKEESTEDDTELVAVIAAAIAAYEGSQSTDGFVVRSIRKRR